jgi:hypothetical protein
MEATFIPEQIYTLAIIDENEKECVFCCGMNVARLIEKSFGKGSFRKLAERSADTLNR